MSLKDDILELDDRQQLEEVEVPEWDLTVYVGQMSAAERDKLESDSYDLDREGNLEQISLEGYRARVCALTVYNEDGERVFNFSDWEQLADKSAKAIDRIFEVAAEVNGLTQKDIEDTVSQ